MIKASSPVQWLNHFLFLSFFFFLPLFTKTFPLFLFYFHISFFIRIFYQLLKSMCVCTLTYLHSIGIKCVWLPYYGIAQIFRSACVYKKRTIFLDYGNRHFWLMFSFLLMHMVIVLYQYWMTDSMRLMSTLEGPNNFKTLHDSVYKI